MPDDTFVVGSKAGAVHLAMARPVELGLYILGACCFLSGPDALISSSTLLALSEVHTERFYDS